MAAERKTLTQLSVPICLTGFATYGSNGGNSNWTYSGNNMLYGGTQITGNTGGNGSHNNIEPYIATYIYKRIG